jgi:hypothetical protein
MITAAQCFYEITCDTSALMQHCVSQISSAAHSDWFDYYGFQCLQLDTNQVAEHCHFIKQLDQWLSIQHLGITKMTPMQYYRLHTDANRGVSVNMLISHEHSHCVFVDDTQMLELEYQPGVFYVFNSQIPHTVLNLSGIRYSFQLEFQEPKQVLSFNRALRYIKSLQKNLPSHTSPE